MSMPLTLQPIYHRAMINSDQCRAARAILKMSQGELSKLANVPVIAIKRFEAGGDPRASTVNAIERALVEAGVTLIDDGAASATGSGPGVRLTNRAGAR